MTSNGPASSPESFRILPPDPRISIGRTVPVPAIVRACIGTEDIPPSFIPVHGISRDRFLHHVRERPDSLIPLRGDYDGFGLDRDEIPRFNV